MSTVTCFVTLMLCHDTLSDRQQVLDLGSQVCPYTNFCSTDAWKIMPNGTDFTDEPCCFPCSCDDECWELDNCCPDKELIDTTRHFNAPCKDSDLYTRLVGFGYLGEFYKVVDACPFSENWRNFEPKCNEQNRTSLEDFIWVSDNTGKIYQNIHCAKCHGIQETVPWQIRTMSSDIMRANFSNLRKVLLSKNYNIKNIPPEDLQGITAKYACIDPNTIIYNSCNESGLMTSYDSDLETACEQSTWPFNLHQPTFAKNVFCLLCNHQDFPQRELCISPGGKGIKERTESYTFIIDYTSLQVGTAEEESSCRLDEMFDEYLVKRLP